MTKRRFLFKPIFRIWNTGESKIFNKGLYKGKRSLACPHCDLDSWCRNISDLSLSTAKDSTCCAELKKNKDLDVLKVTEIKKSVQIKLLYVILGAYSIRKKRRSVISSSTRFYNRY